MPTSREVLESTYRSGRMKKVRSSVFIIQIVLVIVLIIIITIITPGAGLDPLYLPFELYFFIIALMLLVVVAEGFFFKLFGIKWAKSDSERFLMAKDYMKKGIIIIIVAIVIIALLNIMVPIADENIDNTESALVEGMYNITFSSRDAFDLTGAKAITLTSDDGIPLDVYILREKDFRNEDYSRRLNLADDQSINIVSLHYEREEILPQDTYVIHINSHGQNASVTYTIESVVSPTLIPYITIFSGIFAIINAVWVISLLPMKKRYEKTSIYE
ncbi:MAG: hypothetical protein JSV56_11900 [Methanomassiliicoccales archaeon]|nr:MAG: hypothetical protein JSV56_11900 [Methanomassiliicoccales archaeon]